jgi:hypothetical protein
MTPPADDHTLEPWPGYSAQSEDERTQTLEHKVGEARRRGDLLYALAVSAAVAAVEALQRGDGERTDLERTAVNLGRKIDEYGRTHLDDAGGWTPK